MQKTRKALLVAGVVAAIAIVGSALFYFGFRRSDVANASPSPELISEMPAGASTLIYADLAAIRASTFYQQRPDKGPITIPDRDYADFVQSTGFDFEKDLDSVVIASWPAAGASTEGRGAGGVSPDQGKQAQRKAIILAEGRFDHKKIRDYAQREGKVDHQEGREVYLFPTDNHQNWNSVSFLDDHRLAIVDGPSIAPLLDRHGDASAPDPARERAARVAGAAVFAISRVPPIPDSFAPGGVQSTQLLNLARSVQWVTLAAHPEGNDLRVSLEGECQSDTDARDSGRARNASPVRAGGARKPQDAKVHGSRRLRATGIRAEKR